MTRPSRPRRETVTFAVRCACGIAAALLGLGAAVACGQDDASDEQEGGSVPETPIDAVLDRNTDQLMAIPGVSGTGIGECDGRPCIKVYVERDTPALREQLPEELDGYPVAVEEIGEVEVLNPS